jgi:hypothetical protein
MASHDHDTVRQPVPSSLLVRSSPALSGPADPLHRIAFMYNQFHLPTTYPITRPSITCTAARGPASATPVLPTIYSQLHGYDTQYTPSLPNATNCVSTKGAQWDSNHSGERKGKPHACTARAGTRLAWPGASCLWYTTLWYHRVNIVLVEEAHGKPASQKIN